QTARGHGRQGRVQPISQRPVRSQGDVGALLATPTPLVTFGCLAARVWIRQARLVSSMISGHTTPPPQHGLWYPAPRRPTRTALMGPKVQARPPMLPVAGKQRCCGSISREIFGSSAGSAWIQRVPVVLD